MDAELKKQLEKAQQGDVQGFSYVATAFRDAVLGWAGALTGDRHAAEDAAQEALLLAFKKLGTLRELEAFPAWLRALTRTAVVRQLRRKRPDTISDPEEGVEEEASASSELIAAVHGAVKELGDGQQQVIERHYLRGEKVNEIAKALNLPPGTVKRRLHDAREKLRVKLSGFGPAANDDLDWRG